MAESWRRGAAKALERQNAALLEAVSSPREQRDGQVQLRYAALRHEGREDSD